MERSNNLPSLCEVLVKLLRLRNAFVEHDHRETIDLVRR